MTAAIRQTLNCIIKASDTPVSYTHLDVYKRQGEIYGPESSGKTTVALHCVAEAQKAGGVAAFIDAEHALDPVYAKKLGVNIDDLYISQPDTRCV